ncbi:MAG TPA: hypothetical protein VFC23_09990 [Thermoanaerobaculia bacterium]|nr:hypothetical protein [Thermoanaerobaculia bacterium]
MKRRLSLGIAVLCLAFCALPILAAAPADPAADALAAIFAPAPDAGGSPSQPQDAAKRPRFGTKSTCIANCWNGSTVTCSGNSCSAVNSACSSGQRGSCTADGVTTSCPVCPSTCSATAICSSGSVSCSGNTECFSVNKCYAYCDGVYHWCPSHGICPL